MKVVVFTLLLVTRASCLYPSSPVSGPLAPVSPLHCSVAGKVSCDWSSDRNTHLWLVQVSPLPFCTPALYSPLLPPTGHVWRPVVYIMPQVKNICIIGKIFILLLYLLNMSSGRWLGPWLWTRRTTWWPPRWSWRSTGRTSDSSSGYFIAIQITYWPLHTVFISNFKHFNCVTI